MKAKNCILKLLCPRTLFADTEYNSKSDSSGEIPLESEEGQRLLAKSSYCQNYELLNYYFQEQKKFNYCGVASAAVVLNTLLAHASTSNKSEGFDIISQDKIFEDKIKPTIFLEKFFFGLTLKQLEQLLKAYSLDTEIHYVDKSFGLERFKTLCKSSINQANTLVIVNYGQYGGLSGHICPLGGYESETERFMILDVAQKNSSVWVKAETLYSAMATRDPMPCLKPRGFIVVSKNC